MWPFTPRESLPLYAVTLALSGQHPYRREPEFSFPDSAATVHVHARSWDDAQTQAFKMDVLGKLKFWSARIIKIEFETASLKARDTQV